VGSKYSRILKQGKIIALKDEDGYTESDTYGYVLLGESDDDVEQGGEPWEFDINLTRGIEVY